MMAPIFPVEPEAPRFLFVASSKDVIMRIVILLLVAALIAVAAVSMIGLPRGEDSDSQPSPHAINQDAR